MGNARYAESQVSTVLRIHEIEEVNKWHRIG
jgi:hypothetical protein